MLQLAIARAGKISDQVKVVANAEGVSSDLVRENLANGRLAIPCNKNRGDRNLYGIGAGMTVKVNANIGTSGEIDDIEMELEKLRAVEEAGAHAVMDLSTGGDLRKTRKILLENTRLCTGSVPIYEAAAVARRTEGSFNKLSVDTLLEVIRWHAEDGIDFLTLHCGVTRESAKLAQDRICGTVSRGGTLLVDWMEHNNEENPLYTHYDEVLDICREYDVTISLGDGMRPGSLADSFDQAQIHELYVLAELTRRAWERDVQVIIEGPGHVPLDQVEAQVKMMKTVCKDAPFYILGPLVTDVAPGYDHITGAIGGAVAAMAGADFLCYVTPAEHLSLPDAKQAKHGVIASRIAAHAADVARGHKGARDWDDDMSRRRAELDWEGMFRNAIDPETAQAIRTQGMSNDPDVCSMCGEFCTYKVRKKDTERQ
ncbi:MAG: phosphomethylpyrimidine synthase ThiC [Planctomycetota bacterium]|nr:phosphomethylpyrimidine synthase ThiC [Planctomycetota bacterium]